MTTLILNADGSPISVLPLATVSWNEAIKSYYLDKVDIIEFYDDWVVSSPSTTMKVPSVVMTREFFNVSKSVSFCRENLLLRDNYTCQYCGFYGYENQDLLTQDHVDPRFHGGETKWDNISIACTECNVKKGHKVGQKPNILPYRPTYFQLVKNRKKYPIYVADRSWIDYIDWPSEKIVITKPNKH